MFTSLLMGLLASTLVFSQQGGETNGPTGAGNEVSISAGLEKTGLVSFFRALEETVPLKFYYKEEWFASDSVETALGDMPQVA